MSKGFKKWLNQNEAMWLEIEWDVVLLYSYTIYEAWVRGKEMIIIIMYIFMPENSICNIY